MNSYVERFRELEIYKKQRDVSQADFKNLTHKGEEIGRMLGAMIRKAELFASPDYRTKEEAADYLTEN